MVISPLSFEAVVREKSTYYNNIAYVWSYPIEFGQKPFSVSVVQSMISLGNAHSHINPTRASSYEPGQPGSGSVSEISPSHSFLYKNFDEFI